MGGKILVTGCTGFIGKQLINHLSAVCKSPLIGIARRELSHSGLEKFYEVDLSEEVDLSPCLNGVETIVHTAGMAHTSVSAENEKALEQLMKINVDSTVELAKQASLCGAKRFIFISSIGVNGNINTSPFIEDDTHNPAEFYAKSKWEAEQCLWEIQRESGMELVIIRPPLVYGPHAPGKFSSLIYWVEKGIPLPLGAIHNKRSLVALDNLVDLIITCIDHPAAANHVFLAGDGQDLSTTELLQGVAKVMGKPSRLIPVPVPLLMFGATLLGKKAVAQSLLGSLQVDISKARELLDWTPPLSVEEGLRRCIQSEIK